jgi:hypothetical protein
VNEQAELADSLEENQAMATSTTALPVPNRAAETAVAAPRSRRRRIDPQSGHALEILGHAIEYLTDEYVHEGGALNAHNGQIEAVQMLMAANRAIYFACPPVPTLGDRLRRILGLRRISG